MISACFLLSVLNQTYFSLGDWHPKNRKQKLVSGVSNKWVGFFFCYLSSPSCFLPCCFCYKKKCIWCCFQNSKLSCFTSFTISMQLLRYFSPVFLFYFNHAFVFWIYFTWMNSELKLELKSRMLSHRLEMLSLFLRQVWDLKESKFERSVWVISVFICDY